MSFRRDYAVTVDTLRFTGLRCQFSCHRTLKTKPNTVSLKITNLSDPHRSAIEQRPTSTIQIDAGYLDEGTSTIFIGDVRNAGTTKDGTDWVTEFSAGDGEKALRTARASQSFRKGTTTVQVVKTLAAALGVAPGNIAQAIPKLAPFGDCFSLGTVLAGSAERELTRVLRSVGYTWSVQNGALQVLPIKQVLLGAALNLNAATGLIGSPTVDKDGVMTCKAEMIPDVFPGRLLVLTADFVKGQFRIEETTHSGDTHGEDWSVEIKGKRF